MKKILFMRSQQAFLPEIDAYIKYFNQTQEFTAYDSNKIEGYNLNEFDIVWEMKGFGGIKSNNKIIIHDYASLSVGNFPRVKNIIKSVINPKPDLRVFLNEDVKRGFRFWDNIEYCYRDMGINEEFLYIQPQTKEYDFVYIGAICKERGIDKLLEQFTKNKLGKLCLIGNVENELYQRYKGNNDLIFTGKVEHLEVPLIASKAIYGINYIPDKYPYNLQTSTKLLEYLAMGLKVITTDYKWVREFEKRESLNFYKINNQDINIQMKGLEKFSFKLDCHMDRFNWDNIIENSKIKDKIIEIIK